MSQDVCARCHTLGQGCCLNFEESENWSFGLTFTEIARLTAASGKPASYFCVPDTILPYAFADIAAVNQVLVDCMPNKKRFRLKTINNRCVFLGPTGCILQWDARPYYCRLYPLLPQGNAWQVLTSNRCLAQKEVATPGQLFGKLGLQPNSLVCMYASWQQAANTHKTLYTAMVSSLP